MKKNLFITIEGPDGSGKSTQISRICDFLAERGFEVVRTREPGGTAISEKIRAILLDKANTEMDHMTEALLYAASRAQLVAEVIKPALAAGKAVVCDRFLDSSIAYQGYGRRLGDCVREINEYAVQGCMPDITFLLKLDPEVGRHRISDEAADRIERENADFHRAVFNGYLDMEKRFADRIVGIDAGRSIDEISDEIRSRLMHLLDQEDPAVQGRQPDLKAGR